LGEPLGFVLESVRPKHDNNGLIVRYWNARGLHDDPSLILKGAVSAVWRCDLMEKQLENLPIDRHWSDDTVAVRIPASPHSIETLLIEFDKA
jgi:hypothetical protein